MSLTTNTQNKQNNSLILLYSLIYVAASLLGSTAISSALGITAPFSLGLYALRILGLPLLLLAGGKRTLSIGIFPVLALCIFEFFSASPVEAACTALECTSVICISYILYHGYKSEWRKSELCSVGSAIAVAFDVLTVAVTVAVSAYKKGVKFSSMLFESIDEIINSYITAYTDVFESMAEIAPELYTQTPAINTELLHSSFILVITLLPAILYCVYFAVMYVCSLFVDLSNKKHSFVNYSFGKYEISGITYGLFTFAGILLVLSLLFDDELSGFAMGILSVVLVIFPHFVIFGYKRIFGLLSRLCGKGGAIALTIVFSGLLCLFALQIFLCILAMFGTSQYRIEKFQEKTKK